MYLEETDLSWRVWLAGYRVVFIPGAVVYHAYNTARKNVSDRKYYPTFVLRYYGCRNYIQTLIKNLGAKNLCRYLPLHLACWLLLGVLFILKRSFAEGWYILMGIWWNVINLPHVLRKRAAINRLVRTTDDGTILRRVSDHKPLGYYAGKGFAYLTGRAF